jgi:hypothetical protein
MSCPGQVEGDHMAQAAMKSETQQPSQGVSGIRTELPLDFCMIDLCVWWHDALQRRWCSAAFHQQWKRLYGLWVPGDKFLRPAGRAMIACSNDTVVTWMGGYGKPSMREWVHLASSPILS